MKWLSKIFKGSGGSARAPTTGGRNSQFLEDENMVWGAPSTSVVTHICVLFLFFLKTDLI